MKQHLFVILVLTLALATCGARPSVMTPTATSKPLYRDTDRIAFSSYRNDKYDIYVMHGDGSGQIRLTNGQEGHSPTWSPDGTRIAFVSKRVGKGNIYVMSADGSGLTNLTISPSPRALVECEHTLWKHCDQISRSPAWSPDGRHIAFSAGDEGDEGEIYVMNADGSGLTPLTNTSAHHNDTPAWSPDGQRIAFSSGAEGKEDIYVMNADGSDLTNLTNTTAQEASPTWSPDGTRIAFVSNRDGNFDIYMMNADGSGLTQLTNSPARDLFPAWSPDGRRIAFASDREGNPDGTGPYMPFEIYVMNADGSAQTNLTNSPADDRAPAWRFCGCATTLP
jgi:Tol biopolymer transport system component